jgi:hypothetical protein
MTGWKPLDDDCLATSDRGSHDRDGVKRVRYKVKYWEKTWESFYIRELLCMMYR